MICFYKQVLIVHYYAGHSFRIGAASTAAADGEVLHI